MVVIFFLFERIQILLTEESSFPTIFEIVEGSFVSSPDHFDKVLKYLYFVFKIGVAAETWI